MDSHESGKGILYDTGEIMKHPRTYGFFLLAFLAGCGTNVEQARQSLMYELSGTDLKPGATITMNDPGYGTRMTGDSCFIGRGSVAHLKEIRGDGSLTIKEWRSKNPCIVKGFPPGSVKVIRK